MKKFGIFACAALATLCTARLSAAVESDIVGYNTIEMKAGKWYMVGSAFSSLDGVEDRNVNDVFNVGFAEGDRLMTYNSVSGLYTTAYWRATANEGKGGWCTRPFMAATLTSATVTSSSGVFIYKETDGTAMVSGKVLLEDVPFGVDGVAAWAMVVAPTPEKIDNINNALTWENVGEGDELMVYNSDTGLYDTAYWRATANEGKGGWCTRPFMTATLKTVALTPGQAMFINKKSKTTGLIKVK